VIGNPFFLCDWFITAVYCSYRTQWKHQFPCTSFLGELMITRNFPKKLV
jgi:hypothetical protein